MKSVTDALGEIALAGGGGGADDVLELELEEKIPASAVAALKKQIDFYFSVGVVRDAAAAAARCLS